jgi:glutathione S-transferase
MLTLYQAEWCPHSTRVRQRLTELGVDFVAKQVSAEPEERDAMREAVGTAEIPVLVTDGGGRIEGDDEILSYLDAHFHEPPDAAAHQEKSLEHADERDPRASSPG